MTTDGEGGDGKGRKSDVAERLEKRISRKMRAREDRGRPVWFGLGAFGIVGWSVTVPTLVGLALGLWLDRHAEMEGFSWTLAMLLAGLMLGCWNAWYWVTKETKEEH